MTLFWGPKPRPTNRLNRYWRLRDNSKPTRRHLEVELQAIWHTSEKSTHKELLLIQTNGALRGNLNYHARSLEELQTFLKARGLPLSDDKDIAIETLWRADGARKFPNFLELPPELRNRVYDFHFAAMPQKLRPCSQPPITKTSQLVRSETLPLFYSNFTFELLISRMDINRRSYLRPENEVELFLAKTSEQNFRDLRKLHIRVEAPRASPDAEKGKCMVSCDLKINPVAQTFEVEVKPSATKKDIVAWRQAGAAATEQIAEVLKRACERATAGLGADDVYEVRDVLENLFC